MIEERATYQLGFAALAEQIPEIVGEPLEDEHYSGEGNSLQATTGGLLVWRKADNWTAFTDGYETWVNGPNGVEQRLNTELFGWEQPPAPPEYRPRFIMAPTPSETFPFMRVPKGVILHGTRSGIEYRHNDAEFDSTVAYAMRVGGPDGLAWNYTVGPGIVAQHAHPKRWGWNARVASMYYVAIEIAQPTIAQVVSDDQVQCIAWCIRQIRAEWPTMPLYLPTHAELEHLGETGRLDGKSDIFAWYSIDRAEDLRGRIMAELTQPA